MTEKSPLPAIIVTPSSPVNTHDFSIAFLAPPPKPTVRERLISSANNLRENSWLAQSRSFRTFLILALLFFVMITTHLITHRHTVYPYPRFQADLGHRRLPTDPATSSRAVQIDSSLVSDEEPQIGIISWIGFELRKAWSVGGGVVIEDYMTVESNISQKSGSLLGVE
jgi:hypothetical protein